LKTALPFSAAAHLALLALLFLLPAAVAVPPKIDLSKVVEVIFAPPPSPPPAPTPPAPTVEQLPPPAPEPPPAPIATEPPPPAAPAMHAETPPPRALKPRPKPIPKLRPEPVQQAQRPAPPLPLPLPRPSQAPPQMASVPSPPPVPTISPDYRVVLSSWLATHKHYPEDARQRGEEGRAVLRFRVDRSGRVIDYSVVSSTGFTDLDAAVEGMMRGAVLPPFPPSMREPEIEVSVTIRFGLTR